MKRITLIICFVVSLICLLIGTVFAHPGRTDSKGGHTDHSTGEYHYHHGYSAHDHYDMDGDGVVDCPYDFDDKTDHSSGDSNASSSYVTTPRPTTPPATVPTHIQTVTQKEDDLVPNWVYWVIATLVVFVVVLLCLVRRKSIEIEKLKRNFEEDKTRDKQQIACRLKSLHNALIKTYGKDYLYEISNAPNGDYIGSDSLPHSQGYKVSESLDAYTFYLGGSPFDRNTKFHHNSCRYGNHKFAINAYKLRGKSYYQSCNVCYAKHKIPDTKWVDEYLEHYSFLGKYLGFNQEK